MAPLFMQPFHKIFKNMLRYITAVFSFLIFTSGIYGQVMPMGFISSTVGESQEVYDVTKGGILAYVFQVGDYGYIEGETHGIIVDTADFTTGVRKWTNVSGRAFWGNSGIPCVACSDVTGAVGYGAENTLAIQTFLADYTYESLFIDCSTYSSGTYSDWFVPSLGDLEKIYQNISNLSNANLLGEYWSSNDFNFGPSATRAYTFNLTTGVTGNPLKEKPYLVRLIRYF